MLEQTDNWARINAESRKRLARVGISTVVTSDQDLAEGTFGLVDKSYLTPALSKYHNDFTPENSAWVIAFKDEQPAAIGGVRVDNFGREGSLFDFLPKMFERQYGKDGELKYISPSLKEVTGTAAYFGDLCIGEKFRGPIMARQLEPAMQFFLSLTALKWQPDWLYCFLRERHAANGSAFRNGFTRVYRNSHKFVEPKPPRSNSEVFCGVPLEEYHPTLIEYDKI